MGYLCTTAGLSRLLFASSRRRHVPMEVAQLESLLSSSGDAVLTGEDTDAARTRMIEVFHSVDRDGSGHLVR